MQTGTSASELADASQLIDPQGLVQAYYERQPDVRVPGPRVAFGTSGHRGSALHTAFNEDHTRVIYGRVCD